MLRATQSQSSYFKSVLDSGLIFLPGAKFKSLLSNLDVGNQIVDPLYPSITSIQNFTLNGVKLYDNCIAFSINNDLSVSYKYQLFPEDIESVTTVTSSDVGVYIKSLDSFNTLIPIYSKLGYSSYGSSTTGLDLEGARTYASQMNSYTSEDRMNAFDGAWTLPLWQSPDTGTYPVALTNPVSDCGYGTHGLIITDNNQDNTLTNRIVIKPRRVGSGLFELFATANNTFKNRWYYIVRRSAQEFRYWVVRENITQTILTKSVYYSPGNLNPTRTMGTDTHPSYAPQSLWWSTSPACIKVDYLKTGLDCGRCMLMSDTDKYGNVCDGGNYGNFYIIQPSWRFIMEQLMKNNGYNLQKNFCLAYLTYGKTNYIPKESFPITNEYLEYYFTVNTCNNCFNTTDCTLSAAPYCKTSTNTCVGCLQDENCLDGKSCIANQCQYECQIDSQCQNSSAPYCQILFQNFKCVNCMGDYQCPTGQSCVNWQCRNTCTPYTLSLSQPQPYQNSDVRIDKKKKDRKKLLLVILCVLFIMCIVYKCIKI